MLMQFSSRLLSPRWTEAAVVGLWGFSSENWKFSLNYYLRGRISQSFRQKGTIAFCKDCGKKLLQVGKKTGRLVALESLLLWMRLVYTHTPTHTHLEFAVLFFENTCTGLWRFGGFCIWLYIFEKMCCRFQYVNLGEGNKPSFYAYYILAFHSHLTSLQLWCSVWFNSFTDTYAFGIQDWRK